MENIRKAASDVAQEEINRARSQFHDVADQAVSKGREQWNDIRDRGEQAWRQARERSQEALTQTRKAVTRHPGRSIGLALLVGAVIGALISFRDND